MKASNLCQGRGCERKAECQRYTDTKNWPLPVMSKLCDSRFVAFLPKEQAQPAPAQSQGNDWGAW